MLLYILTVKKIDIGMLSRKSNEQILSILCSFNERLRYTRRGKVYRIRDRAEKVQGAK